MVCVENFGFAGSVIKYVSSYGSGACPSKVRNLGELKGSWFEIGSSYAQKSSDFIQIVFEDTYKKLENLFGLEHLLLDLCQYRFSISNFSTQAVNFMKGIAVGAKEAFDQSEYSDVCTDYMKVIMMCCRNELLFRHPANCYNGKLFQKVACGREGCSALAIVGKDGGAREKETIIAHNNDGPFGLLLNVSYIAVPDDCNANSFWSLGLAGQPTFSQANSKGLIIVETAGGVINPFENAFGVPWQIIAWHTIAYSSSVEEATKIITSGTGRYRKITGKKSLLRTGGCNYLLADGNDLRVLETSARRYSIRLAGDLNEEGRYIVLTNHNFMDHSYDEQGTYTETSMVHSIPPGSDKRFWTLMHLIKNNFGNIDERMVQEFMSSHLIIDHNGEKLNFGTHEVPPQLSELNSVTPCAHEGGYPEQYIGGTEESKVLTIREDEIAIKYVQGRPCEWKGKWDGIILKKIT